MKNVEDLLLFWQEMALTFFIMLVSKISLAVPIYGQKAVKILRNLKDINYYKKIV